MSEAKLPEGWKDYWLGDVVLKIGSGATPKGGGDSYKESGISLIRSQNILDFRFSVDGLAFIDYKQADKLKNVTVNSKDILLNITGDSVARCCIVPIDILPARVNQHVSIIRADSSKSYAEFIFYSLQGMKQELLQQSEIGATRKAITKVMLEKLPITLPPLPEQKAIAEVLSSLDDKIDLLHKQNQTLEDLAQTLFREWFIEKADDRWEVTSLSELFDIKIGRTPPRKEKIWFSNFEENNIKWVSIKDMAEQGVYTNKTSECLTKAAVEKFKIPVIAKDTVVLSFKMTLGRVKITGDNMLSNEAIAHFNAKCDNIDNIFLYLFLKTYPYQSLGSTSSIVTSINSAMIKDIQLALPDSRSMKRFNNTATPIFEKIYQNQKQINTLEQARDILLPKLMSGELRVAHD
ncbi:MULTISPECIES: restriction endonuclease subunit S [Cysteiniphilum]|uniref:Type I restriction modification DNA specificity domain-containing protein n=1 Tax=Cysteiniphilum litorale TaxID=2056700 RepID=A0A8J3EA12_9GAMM|nr:MULTISPECIES: restriction endonuclease subunit S [Cysteiniphilum]GGG07308.1 hypothetical protein GCM10010995_26070 [Cysteiniphilum litorale]